MIATGGDSARLPPPGLPGLDPSWSRLVEVPTSSGVGVDRWHVLDTHSPAVGGPTTAGPRRTLLCLHGNPTWSYLWRRLLAQAPDGWRVVAPDQLGMGFSDRPQRARTLADRVEDLGRLTTALRIGIHPDEQVVVVAHDWGGPISTGWALAHRDVVTGLVLANTAVHQPSGRVGPPVIRLARLPGVRQVACALTPTFVAATTALSSPSLPGEVRDAFAAPYRGIARRRAVADFVADVPFAEGHGSRSRLDLIADGLAGWEVPALLLRGPRDPVFGEDHLRDLAGRLPSASIQRYENAGHLVTEDAPRWVDDVLAWIADLDREEPPIGSSQHEERPGVFTALRERADDDAVAIAEVGGVSVSWRQFARTVRDVSAGMTAAGIRPGDRVALLVPPSADLTAAAYAAWRAGAVVVVADKGLGLAGMGRALRGARIDHVVGSAAGLAAARVMRVPGQRIGAGAHGASAWRALGAGTSLAALARRGRGLQMADEPGPDDECAVLFTSGATGPAKGVVYRHRQVRAQLELLRRTYQLTSADRLVAAFAPFAVFGPALGIGSTVPDVDVTRPGTLTAATLARACATADATVVFASPAALRGVLASVDELDTADRTALGRIRLVMSAGAPVPRPLLRRLRSVLPAAQAHTPYGMTEALPVTDVSLAELEEAGDGDGVCVGRPLPGVEVRIAPLDRDGRPSAEPLAGNGSVTGELCVRAAHVKDRYDALWAVQRASASPAGWHRTGDVGVVDDAGRVWVQGRLVHVITTAAGPVTPVGIEQRIEGLDQVRLAAAVGVGPAGTQQVVVVVEVNGFEGGRAGPLAEPRLRDAIRTVAGVPVAAVLVRSALPVDIRHASKIDRAEVAAWASVALQGSWG